MTESSYPCSGYHKKSLRQFVPFETFLNSRSNKMNKQTSLPTSSPYFPLACKPRLQAFHFLSSFSYSLSACLLAGAILHEWCFPHTPDS